MGAKVDRPTPKGGDKAKQAWKVWGEWGEKFYSAMGDTEFYGVLHDEMVRDGVLPPETLRPSKRSHPEITAALQVSSLRAGKWVRDAK